MKLKYIDLFCGIGGFHTAANMLTNERQQLECVFASDIDAACQRTYEKNYGLKVSGDITKIHADEIPDHDILFAGFPCQPFSIIGAMNGFDDTRGTLFFDIARILEAKRPRAFILENVKMLVGHQQGRTLARILETLNNLGYSTTFRVLNALDFGVAQKRERVFIVGFLEPHSFMWPHGGIPIPSLDSILESNVESKYYASEKIRESRLTKQKKEDQPTIWHENKSGNVSKYPYSCALRAGASYNYLLVDGERRLTEREMIRLQGFPESFVITEPYGTTRHQAGNSVAVPVVKAVMSRVLDALVASDRYETNESGQYELVMKRRAILSNQG